MMKTGMLILTFLVTIYSFAQDNSFRKYYDSSWKVVAKENAFYYTDFTKDAAVYRCLTYYANSNSLYAKSSFADTLFEKGIGLRLCYYETGELKDSTFFDAKGLPANQYNFQKNGKIKTHVVYNFNTNVTRFEEFDDNGKLNPKATIIQVSAEFDGGISAWTEYLEKNLNTKVPLKKKAPAGKYTVVVTFVVNEDGKVENVETINDPGYGTKEEALRVIHKSPKWKPATQNGKPVIYRHKQTITFQVSES